MKNTHKLLAGSVVVFMLVLPVITSAQPGSTPPTGVVNAIFNSIQSVTTGNFGTNVSIGGVLAVQSYIENNRAGVNPVVLSDVNGVQVTSATAEFDLRTEMVNRNAGQLVDIQDTDGVRINNVAVAGDSRIQNINAGTPVTFNDADGVQILVGALDVIFNLTNTTGGAVKVTDNDGFQVWRTGGASANLSIVPSGALTTISSTANVTLDLASGAGTLFFRDNLGNSALAMNSFGMWSATAGQPLKIADSEGLGISDNGGNVRLLIDDTGYITQVPVLAAVKVADDDGFEIASTAGVTKLDFAPSATNVGISAPGAGESVWVNDTDGLDVRGPLYNFSAPLQIGSVAKGNQNVVINTHLQLPGGLGTTYARSAVEAVAASGISSQLSVACDSGDKAIACGAGGAAGSTSAFELNYVRLNPDWSDTCQGRATNNWASVRTFEVHIKCWNLDG